MGWSDLGVLMLGLCCAAPVVRGQGYVNIAPGPGKTYSHSSTLSTRYHAGRAVDGDTNRPCFLSKYGYSKFWEVDLGRRYPVQNINVWGRASINDNLTPFNITVDGQHCVTVNSNQPSIRNISVTCSSLLYGQRVRLTKIDTSYTNLRLCEFEIIVPSGVSQCYAGRWGTGCQNNCSNNCGGGAGNNFCYKSTGQCYGECVAGRWGDRCAYRCGQNCATGNCDLKTGNCSACLPGWHGNHCDRDCSSQSCLLNMCDQGSGRCLACNTGYDGYNCTECVQGFSKHNTATCSPCSAFCNTGGCDKVTGNCTNGCRSSFHGDQCEESCSTITSQCVQCTQSGQCTACSSGHFQPPDCTDIKDESSQLSSGSVVGAILGAGLMLTIAVLSVLVFLCWKHRSQKTDQDAETVAASPLDTVTTPNNVPTASPSI